MTEGAVNFSGAAVSLADLAGIDMTQVAERRTSSLPRGTYVFGMVDDPNPPKLEILGEGEKAKAAAIFNMKVLEVVSLKPAADNEAPDKYLGRNHREALFLGDDEAVGYLKAFLVDVGAQGSGQLQQLLLSTVGKRFQATITHRPDKNDADKVYVNVDRNKGKIIALA